MKRLLTIFGIFLSSVCFGQKDLILLTSADNPPYEFMKNGEIVGFDIDLAKIIAAKLDRNLIIKDMPFSSIIPALMAKQGDMALAAITATDARRENIDFSIPYQNNTSALILSNKEDFSYLENPHAFFPLQLLDGKTVGVQLGTHHETDIRAAGIPNLQIRRYDNVNTMIAEINKTANGQGSVYGVIVGTSEAKQIVKRNPKLCTFSLKFADSFSIAMPKNSPLRMDINKIIDLLHENGKISQLEVKWDIDR